MQLLAIENPKLSEANAQDVRLRLASVSRDPDGLAVTVELLIDNQSGVDLSPTGPFPVNIAAFFTSADDHGPYRGEFPRHSIVEIIPHAAQRIVTFTAPMPQPTTGKKLVLTLVQEGNLWFHFLPDPVLIEVPDLSKVGVHRWWDEADQEKVIFGNIPAMNQHRFRNVFSCGEKQRPLFLHLETVNICNLRCVICPYVSMVRPKETMSMDLFEQIVDDYVAMGGGDVGLTPSVGDVFLDKMLVQRVRSLRRRPEIKSLAFVTNAGNAGVLTDEELAYVINECTRINISVYGLDEEENAAMSRRPGKYEAILAQMKRIVALNERAIIIFAFRLLKDNAQARAHEWMVSNFGKVFPNDVLTSFGNWGGAIDTSTELPFGGKWMSPDSMETVGDGMPCAYPLLHLKVSVSGDVKFCSCIDYDSHPENIIGNVKEGSLLEIYNGYRARQLWQNGLSICQGCTHYKSVDLFSKHFDLLSEPIRSLGI